MLLFDLKGRSLPDAVLRADHCAASAADTGIGDEIPFRIGLRVSECEGNAFNWLFRQIETLTATFIELEYRQSVPGFLGGIDFPHIRVLFKQLWDSGIAQFPHLPTQGNSHTRQRSVAFDRCQCKKAALFQPGFACL